MDVSFKPEDGSLPIASEATPLAVRLAQAEMDQAVTTAKAYPRSIQKAMSNILSLATLDETTAQECIYALPRGGKPIKGPSVRLAEIIASQWGNCHVGSRVVAVDRMEKVVIAEGVFHDLETGMKRVAQIQRRISDKNGKLFNDDMIAVTGNAASSIALREAILKGVPKAVWRRAYDAAESVINGDVKTLTQRREEVIRAFAAWGVTPEQIFACIEVGGNDDVGLEEIGTLRAIYAAIKSKEATVEEYFPAVTGREKAAEAARGTATKAAQTDAAPKHTRADAQRQFRQEQAAATKAPPVARREDAKQAGAQATEPAAATTADNVHTESPKAASQDAAQGGPHDGDRAGEGPETAPAHQAAEEVNETEEEPGIDLMSFPTCKTIIDDAMDLGASASREAHAKVIEILKSQQPEVHAALESELDHIGG